MHKTLTFHNTHKKIIHQTQNSQQEDLKPKRNKEKKRKKELSLLTSKIKQKLQNSN